MHLTSSCENLTEALLCFVPQVFVPYLKQKLDQIFEDLKYREDTLPRSVRTCGCDITCAVAPQYKVLLKISVVVLEEGWSFIMGLNTGNWGEGCVGGGGGHHQATFNEEFHCTIAADLSYYLFVSCWELLKEVLHCFFKK